MATITEVRAQHPPFFRTVWADARVTAGYRGERSEFRSRVDGVLQILRLMLVSDAFAAQVCYRAKAALQRRGVIILPRLLHRMAMVLADVAIGDPVVVEPGVYIVHGQVVIDGFTRIGGGTCLFPWITVGLRAGVFQGPTIGPRCNIYTGAKVIGPITLGADVSVGANAVVVADVPDGLTVVGAPARPVGAAFRPDDEAQEAVRRATALADGGDLPGAIDLLTRHNRLAPSPLVERALVQLRHRAAFAHRRAPAPPWPPAFDDRFAGTHGIPEIPASELDVDALRAGVLGHGALIVRGLFPATAMAEVRRLVDLVDDIMRTEDRRRAEWYHEFRSDVSAATAELSAFDRSFHLDTSALLAADSPRALFRLLEMLDRHGIPRLVEQYFGERPALSVEKTVLRKVPPGTVGDWHQDGAFLGTDIRSLNVWIAASDCGTTAPTMELVSRRLTSIVETGTGGACFDWAVGDPVARDAAGPDGIDRPRFREGDAIFFDHMNLHRTAGGPDMTDWRYAVESWWFAPSAYPADTLPLFV